MARPKTITLEHGTVSLQGFPKEVSEALAEHIKNYGKPASTEATTSTVSIPTSSVTTPIPVNQVSSELTDTAVGVRQIGNKYELVLVKYNAQTKDASVLTVEPYEFRREAIMKFKMKASELNFV